MSVSMSRLSDIAAQRAHPAAVLAEMDFDHLASVLVVAGAVPGGAAPITQQLGTRDVCACAPSQCDGGLLPVDVRWPLVGWQEELALVAKALGAPGISGVALAGAAGVGKTRLAREALTAIAARGRGFRWAIATEAGLDSIRCLRAPVASRQVGLGAAGAVFPGRCGPGAESGRWSAGVGS
jgi:hypothetical protein